jgi:hypothetical protein
LPVKTSWKWWNSLREPKPQAYHGETTQTVNLEDENFGLRDHDQDNDLLPNKFNDQDEPNKASQSLLDLHAPSSSMMDPDDGFSLPGKRKQPINLDDL